MAEINKKVVGNYAGLKWTHQQITEFGESKIGEKGFCNPCYEANRHKVPVGEKTILYSHLWDSLEKTGFDVVGKTLTEYFECKQCGHKIHNITTYRNGNTRMLHIEDIKNLILQSAQEAWKSVWQFRGEYKEFTQGRYIGELSAYKHVMGLLGGK